MAQQSVVDGQWPTARKAYETLAAHYPSPNGKTDMDLAEALYRTGAPAAARDRLQKTAAVGGADGAQALLRLAEISEGPWLKTRRVAPRTPMMCAPVESFSTPVRYTPGPSARGTRALAAWSIAFCSTRV